MADVVLFDGGLTIPEARIEDADRVCSLILNPMYRQFHEDDFPGWPSAASKKALLEWYVKRALNQLARSAKKEEYEAAYVAPEDIVGG